jgi:hypothetical protein
MICLEESLTYALWLLTLLQDLQFKNMRPICIKQDNKSTIIIANKGGTFTRSKHILNRQALIAQHVNGNDIVIQYCPTDLMPADMLTKPMTGGSLGKLCKIISIVD